MANLTQHAEVGGNSAKQTHWGWLQELSFLSYRYTDPKKPNLSTFSSNFQWLRKSKVFWRSTNTACTVQFLLVLLLNPTPAVCCRCCVLCAIKSGVLSTRSKQWMSLPPRPLHSWSTLFEHLLFFFPAVPVRIPAFCKTLIWEPFVQLFQWCLCRAVILFNFFAFACRMIKWSPNLGLQSVIQC